MPSSKFGRGRTRPFDFTAATKSSSTCQPPSISGGMRSDRTELEHSLRAVGKGAKHGEQIRNDDVITRPDWVDRFPTGEDRGDVAQPALQHFNVNTERHHIQTADLDPLPP